MRGWEDGKVWKVEGGRRNAEGGEKAGLRLSIADCGLRERKKLGSWEDEKVGSLDFGFGIVLINFFLFKLPLPIAEKVLHQALNPY
jgi:hypothetical protein